MAKQRRRAARADALVDGAVIRGLSVLLVGAGRVGMAIGMHLARIGIMSMTIIDADRVSQRDLGNAYGFGAEGQPKALALKRTIESWNPTIDVTPCVAFVGDSGNGDAALLKGIVSSDVCLWAGDDWTVLQAANARLYSELPVVAVAMSERGAIAELAWSAPGQTACVCCALNASERQTAHGAPSVHLDVDIAANTAVSVALGLCLAGHKGYELFGHLLDPEHNLIMLHNRDNSITRSNSPTVPRMVRLLRVDRRCGVCRRS